MAIPSPASRVFRRAILLLVFPAAGACGAVSDVGSGGDAAADAKGDVSAEAGDTAFDSDTGTDPGLDCGPGGFAEMDSCVYAVDGRRVVVQDAADAEGSRARVIPPASLVEGSWGDAALDPSAPPCAALDAAAREHVAQTWRRRASEEHASIAAFHLLALDLLRFGAPPELLAAVQRAAADELAHASLALGVVAHVTGRAERPGPLEIPASAASEERASVVRNVVEGCVLEAFSAVVVEQARRNARDPLARRALARISVDESSHASLSFRLLQRALGEGAADRSEIVLTFRAAIDRLGASIEARAAAPSDGALDRDVLHAFGCVLDDELPALFEDAKRNLWAPALARLGLVA